MKHKIFDCVLSLLLALVCVLGILPLSAFAAGLSSAPGSITQKDCDYMYIGGRPVRYESASNTINHAGLPFVFDEQVTVPGLDAPVRALCSYHDGSLGSAANGQKWDFKTEVTNPSLKVLLTYVYAHTYGDFTDAGNARGLETWGAYWSDIWFMVAQAMTWYYEYSLILDVNADREAFIEQAAEEFIAAMKLYHKTYGQSSWIKDWDAINTHSIIDSNDGGKTGYSAYDYIATGVNLVLDHPEYYHNYHLWEYDWDKSQPWKLVGHGTTEMQRLLIAVPDDDPVDDTVQLTVKKLEAGSNKPMAGVSFKVEGMDGDFSATRTTGADGTFTLTDADGLSSGQYMITEEAVPEGYVAQTASQLVTVLPNGSANSVFTFFNEPNEEKGDGSIRKVDADNPTVGIPGAVIRITSVKLDDGGSFMSEYTTKDGGYILKSDLDFSKLPTGSYIAEEITPPEGYILSPDVSKVKQAFVWDGKHDISLIFENSSKVKVKLVKLDESGQPLAGAIFVVLRDGQVIETKATETDGTITISNVTEGYYEFREVEAPEGFDCDRSPVGVHVNAEDLQGEQTITVTKTNHRLRTLTIQKRDTETGAPIANTSFHIHGVNLGFEEDVVTGADGKATLSNMPSGCYEITETDVPAPYLLDTNNRKTVWIDSEKDKDIVVDFVNSTRPGLRLRKVNPDGEPVAGATFLVEEVNGGYSDQHLTDKDGMIILDGLTPGAYIVTEKKPAPGYVGDDTPRTVYLEENRTTTIELVNLRKPNLKIVKEDSITHSPIANVKFQIWRGSDDTITGELNDLGVFTTNANGEIFLEKLDTGWYRIKELEPAPGYTIKQPDTQDIYLKPEETHVVRFENTPKNAIVVEKYDSVTHEALPGCTFQLRWLGGASGTGGTVIGQKVTGKNGIAMWTGLEPGTYIIEEVDPADGYSIIQSSETVFLADSGEQSVVTVRFNNSPDGSILIRKVCATNPSITLQNAEFKVMYSDGVLIGDSNGIFRSDENGEVRIEGLKPGKSVVVTEVKAPAGFIIDTQSQTIQIKEGRTVSLTFKNQPKGKLIVQKRDSATNQPLPGAEFRITTAAGCEVGLDGVIGTSTLTQNGIFTTDAQGEIRITNLAPGAYVLTEIKAPDGYVMDSPSTNVVIGTGGDTQTVVVKNSKAGSLVILKKSTDGKPLEGVEFKATTSTGEFVPDASGHISSNGLYYTDKDGKITINGVVGTLVVTETKSIPGYTIDEATRTQTVDVRPNDTQTLYFYNKPSTTLIIEKYIEGAERKPLKGVTFLVTDSSGKVVGNSNGEFVTDEAGRIVLEGLEPGTTITAREIKTLEGYELDGQPKSILIKEGEVQYLRFYNQVSGTIVVRKLDKDTLTPLAGVEFQIVYSDGRYLDDDYGHLSSKGLYKTDSNGEIRISGVSGTLVITETKPLPGYVMDEGTRQQTVKVNPADTQTITVYNTKIGGLTIIKKDEETSERIPGVQMEVRKLNGEIVGTFTTDSNGLIQLPQAEKGWYQVVELKAAKGYTLDDTPHRIEVKDGQTATLEVTNRKAGSALIHKVDSLTGEGIFGVTFLVSDAMGNPIGTYQSDNEGYVYIDKTLADGKYTIREIECADGYILDTQPKTFYVQYGGCTTITWPNTAVRGQIQIVKKSADYNSTNGLPAGTPLAGATFEIYNERNGNKVDTIVTDKNGLASSKALPLGRYTIKETKAPANYGATNDTFTAVLEYSGQIVKLEITNKSVDTGVSIEKTGPKEAMSGQPVRYVFSHIGNTSNVTLQSFYWRDTLPAAVKLDKIVTGTYNFPGTYKIVYKVNNSGDYLTLADNLSTGKNYTLAASPVALGLASNQRVTEIMFVFGQAPGGFSQVEAPMVYCTALPGLAPGSSFVNVADVGGTYNGIWLQAVTRWVTNVYGKPIVPTLPKTGY